MKLNENEENTKDIYIQYLGFLELKETQPLLPGIKISDKVLV